MWAEAFIMNKIHSIDLPCRQGGNVWGEVPPVMDHLLHASHGCEAPCSFSREMPAVLEPGLQAGAPWPAHGVTEA